MPFPTPTAVASSKVDADPTRRSTQEDDRRPSHSSSDEKRPERRSSRRHNRDRDNNNHQQQQTLNTPHGFHERRTIGQMLADADSGVSPGIMSDALLLRAMGTKPPVHHIPTGSSASSEDGGGSGEGQEQGDNAAGPRRGRGFRSLPPPPLVSVGCGSDCNKKRGISPSRETGGRAVTRQRRSLPTAAHRSPETRAASASSSSSSSSKKGKKKAPAAHRFLQSSCKSTGSSKQDPKLDAAAALKSLASSSSSSDSESSTRSTDSPKDWSRGSKKSKKKKKEETEEEPRPPQEDEPMLHGVIPISSLTNRSGPMLVDHSYTDYSIVDPDSLRVLDEEQGLCPSGFEWEGLNEDPHIITTCTTAAASLSIDGGDGSGEALAGMGGKYDDAEEDEDGYAAAAVEERMDKGPEYEREKGKTIRKLRKMFKGIRPSRRNSGGVVQPFPGKLMEVLDREDIEDILSWMPHGRAFVVKQPKVFTADVLPRFFKQSKYMSFTRQLNLWGFKRITRGRDAGAYYHELFLRGRPRLTLRMRRQKIKGTGIKLTPNPDAEPDFYEMAKVRPLPEPRRSAAGTRPKPMPPKLEFPQRRGVGAEVGDAINKAMQRHSGREYATPFFSGKGHEVAEPSSPAPDSSAPFGGQDGYPDEAAATRTRSGSEDAAASSCQKESASSADEVLLAAEVLRQRELAAAELLLGARRKESPLEALLRLQAAELKAKQEAVLTSQGLLQQLDGIIPGMPTTPPNTVAELQRRLLAAARALDQPAVQAAVMEEQRRSQLATLLAGGSTSPSISTILGSDLGLLSRLTDPASTLDLLKVRGALGGGSSSSLGNLGASSSASGSGADGGANAGEILGLAAALESHKKEDEAIASALKQYAAAASSKTSAAAPSSPSLVASTGSSLTAADTLRLSNGTSAAEEEVLKVMSTMGK